MRIGAVLMASGLSRRFGSNKLFYEIEGIPLYLRAFSAYPPELFSRACVVSWEEKILAAAQARGYETIENHQAQEGQSASIRLGTQALSELDAILYAVCDQPFMTSEEVKRLLDAHRRAPRGSISALAHEGKRGNPVIFDRAYFPALAALHGDVGGSAVIRQNAARLQLIEVSNLHSLCDVDRMEDIQRDT